MSWLRGVLEMKKGTPKEVRGACLRHVANQWARLWASYGEETHMYIGRVDKEEPEVVKWIRPSFEKEWK